MESIHLARRRPPIIAKLAQGLLAWCAVTALTGGVATGVVVWFIADRPLAAIAVSLIGMLILATLFMIGRIYQPAACRVWGDILQEQPSEPATWQALLRQHGIDSLLLGMAGPLISLLGRHNGHKPGTKIPPEEAWQRDRYLVDPVMGFENLNLKEGVLRVGQMVNDHLPRIAPALLGVAWLTTAIAALAGLIGVLLGAGAALGSASLGGMLWRAVGAGGGFLLAGLFAGAGIAFRTLILAAYHTSLYLWAQRAGQACQAGSPDGVVVPPILAAAIGHHVV